MSAVFVLITAAGARWWRLKFRVAGKEKLLSPGIGALLPP
jgi:hypothetical protein